MELNPSQPSLTPQQLPTQWSRGELLQGTDGKWTLKTPQNAILLGTQAQWLRESAVAYTKAEQGLIAIRLLNAQGGLGKFLGLATLLDTLASAETSTTPKSTDSLEYKQVALTSAYTSEGKLPAEIPFLSDTEKSQASIQFGRILSVNSMEDVNKNTPWIRMEMESLSGKLMGYSRESVAVGTWREFSQDSLGQIVFTPSTSPSQVSEAHIQNPSTIANQIIETFLKPIDDPTIKNELAQKYIELFKEVGLEKTLVQNGVAGLRDVIASTLRDAGFANFSWQSQPPTLEEAMDRILPFLQNENAANIPIYTSSTNAILNQLTNQPANQTTAQPAIPLSPPQILSILTVALGNAELLQFLPKQLSEELLQKLLDHQNMRNVEVSTNSLSSITSSDQHKTPLILTSQLPLEEWISKASIHQQNPHTRELAHFLASAIAQQWGQSVSMAESEGSMVYYNEGAWQGVKWKWDAFNDGKKGTGKKGKSKGLKLRLNLTAILLGAVEVGLTLEDEGLSLDLGNDGVDLNNILKANMPDWAVHIEAQGYPLKSWIYHKLIPANVTKHVWTAKLDTGRLDLRA